MVEPMDELETELREQLGPRSAPEGFADRVMARIPAQRRQLWIWQPAWRWAAAGALVAAVALGGAEREHQQRVAGERAREQVLLALRITGTTLADVRQKISAGDEPRSARDTAEKTVNQKIR